LSFINPIFLFAAGVALLPIIYHLIRKMRARNIKFSSLIFLKATPKALVKRRKLRDIILLIIRSCILGLLVMAFARPFIPREKIPLISPQQNKSVVFLIDNSYSMQYVDIFEQVKVEVINQLDNAVGDDEFAIVLFSDKPTQMTKLNNDIALQKNIFLNSVDMSNRTTDFYKAMRLAEEILKDAKHKERQIVLFSDFQNNGWSSQFDNWKLASNITFVPIKIISEEVTNSYIVNFDLKQRQIGKNVTAQIGLQIDKQGNFSEQVDEISLWINGEESQKQQKQAVESYQVYFQQKELKKGVYQGFVELDNDNLGIDNFNYFSFVIEEHPSILGIDGFPNRAKNNAFFLKTCFNMGERTIYNFSVGGKQNITSGNLNKNAVLFLTNIRSLTSQQVAQLKEYVEQGGGLVISFGGRVNLEQFSENLLELGVGSLDKRVAMRKLRLSNAIVGEIDLKHPIFALFAKPGSGDIFKPQFKEYVKIIPDSGANIIGKYNTDDAFLIERRLGKGKILVFSSTFNTEWGDFPVNEIYLPFIYQLTNYASASSERKDDFIVGEAVPLNGKPGDEWDIYDPDGTIFKVVMEKNGTAFFRETNIPGNYKAAYASEQRYFSVNIDPRESDLSSKNPDEVLLSVTDPNKQTENESNLAGLKNMADEEQNQKLWRYLLFFIIILFLLETLFANQTVGLRFKPREK
jgi:hypothetical protein